jgi:single-strand DNA-binding protein
MVYRSTTAALLAVVLLLSSTNGSVIMRYSSTSPSAAAMVMVVDAFQTVSTTSSTTLIIRRQRRRQFETITRLSFCTSSTAAPIGRCERQHRRRNGVNIKNTLVRMSSSSDYDDDDDDNKDFFGDRISSKKQTTINKQQQQQQQSITKIKAEGGNDEEEPPMSIEELEMLATPIDEHLPQINAVTLIGRVGNDPEPRYFDDGKVVLNLSLAVRRKYHPLERKVREVRNGDEETDWFPLEFWGRDAEYVTNFVEKGTRLGVTGSLVMDGWVDKSTGEQRRRPKILVRQIDIVESRAEAELRRNGGGGGGANGASSGGGKKRYRDNNDENDDDDGGPSPAGTGGFF